MAQTRNPERKAELLEQILDYLQDRTLASLSFRTLAGGLGISSYVLVYHFGSREQLLGEIVAAIEARLDAQKRHDVAGMTLAEFRHWLEDGWTWTTLERNRQLQRLEFEAAMQDVVAGQPRGTAPANHQVWTELITQWLVRRGLEAEDAAHEARLLVASLYGLAYDYVITGDRRRVAQAHGRLLDRFLRDAERHSTLSGNALL